jgi:hypothetical protein
MWIFFIIISYVISLSLNVNQDEGACKTITLDSLRIIVKLFNHYNQSVLSLFNEKCSGLMLDGILPNYSKN